MNPASGQCLCGDVQFSARLPRKWGRIAIARCASAAAARPSLPGWDWMPGSAGSTIRKMTWFGTRRPARVSAASVRAAVPPCHVDWVKLDDEDGLPRTVELDTD